MEAIAAGTFAMIDMTGFRSSIIKVYVRSSVNFRMSKNRLTHRGNQVGKEAIGNTDQQKAKPQSTQRFADIRNNEVIQAICKHHVYKVALGPERPEELEPC